MKREITNNSFTGGLVMDLNPINTPNNVLTNCLNGTLITYNGNENILQNDMGNGRVETARLPEGYIPLGTAELGGIIYIVSYNPLIDKCQIGSFPSPERNITSNELDVTKGKILNCSQFYEDDEKYLKSPIQRLILLDTELNPGDKFQIASTNINNDPNDPNNSDILSALTTSNNSLNPDKFPKYLKLSVVSIGNDGSITKLNDSLVWHDLQEVNGKYYIKNSNLSNDNSNQDLDEYRNLVQSNYNIFSSKTSGKLGLLAELECIDTFDVSWDAKKNKDKWEFYLFLNWTYDNEDDPNKINLYGVEVKDTTTTKILIDSDSNGSGILQYPQNNSSNDDINLGDTDILTKSDDIKFYNPVYCDDIINIPNYSINGEIKTPRKNDGTDNQFILNKSFSPQPNSEKFNFQVTPAMPFGYMNWLKRNFEVDLYKLGTGNIDLVEYRYYYNEDESITLNWGLDAYPERNKKITDITFNFYNFSNWNDSNESSNKILLNIADIVHAHKNYIDTDRVVNDKWEKANKPRPVFNVDESNKPTSNSLVYYFQYKTNKKSSYSGHFTEKITGLTKDQLYLVEIVINYNNEEKIIKYYRFIYTFNIFNDEYFIYNDFKDIQLEDKLNIVSTVDIKNNTITDIIPPDKVTNYNQTQETKTTYLDKTYNLNLDLSLNLNSFKLFNFNITGLNGKLNNKLLYEKQLKEIIYNNKTSYNNLDFSITDSFETSVNSSSNNVNINKSIKFSIPYLYIFNTLENVSIDYELIPITTSVKWLLYDTYNQKGRLFVSDSYQTIQQYESTGGNMSYVEETGKSNTETGNLSELRNLYSGIEDVLENCDIAIFRCRVHHEADEERDHPSQVEMYPGINNRFYDCSFSTKNFYFIAYGIRTNSGIQLVIPMAYPGKSKANPFLYWGKFAITIIDADKYIHGDSNYDWPDNYKIPVCIQFNNDGSINDKDLNYLEKTVQDSYHKIIKSNAVKNLYSLDMIVYYDNSDVKLNINTDLTATYNITINNINIPSEYPINNLCYKNSTTITDIYTQNLEPLNTQNYIYSFNSVESKILYPNGSIKFEYKHEGSIYDEKGEQKKQWLTIPCTYDTNTWYNDKKVVGSMSVVNEKLQLYIPNLQNVLLQFRSNKNGIHINDVKFLTHYRDLLI